MPLEYQPGMKRVSRIEPWDQQSVPTKERIKEALAKGDKAEALALLDYMDSVESHIVGDHYPIQLETQFTAVRDKFGEDRLETLLREIASTMDSPTIRLIAQMTAEQRVRFHAEFKRSQFAEFEVTEEPDRFVMTLTKCMPNGGMRTTRTSKGELPRHLGRTSKPYDWSWNRSGILYYCALDCLIGEVLPIEQRGAPDFITECATEDGGACKRYYYKDPARIPEEFYKRVGKHKPPIYK